MKARLKATLTLILASLACLLVIAPGAWATDTSTPLTAPVDPAFLAYQEDLAAGSLTTATATGHASGIDRSRWPGSSPPPLPASIRPAFRPAMICVARAD